MPCLSLNLLSIGLFKQSCQLGAELRQMIKQLCIGQIVRSGDVRVPIDCSDPGVENLLPLSVHKISKPSNGWVLRLALAVTSYARIPPNLFSDANTYAVVAVNMRRIYGVRKILPEYGSSTGVPGGKPRTWM